jgi:deoxyribodipyrimidine photo-lyase
MSTIVWFRNDLRLADHPPLTAALERGGPVIPVYIHSADGEGDWPLGGATKWWLHHSLERLDAGLRKLGSRLIVRQGETAEQLAELIDQTGATHLAWGRRYEPAGRARDEYLKKRFRAQGVDVQSYNDSLLWEPWTIQTGGKECYKVFTPFYRKCLETGGVGEELPAPAQLTAPGTWPASDSLDSLGLLPRIPWAGGLASTWQPGPEGAERELARFGGGSWSEYNDLRNFPALSATSRLSPHLHFGEISPRQVWHRLKGWAGPKSAAADPYLRQLVWREFAFHLLYHFPQTPVEPLRPEFARFPWQEDAAGLRAWQRGETGYPLIDAGMRELWQTGWMHNRVRMATASFLVKDLLIPWQEGARWFWDTLVDADLANNTLGWQWTAGCGADAAPYFRIFNPVSQSEKFDAEGAYLRRYLPELAKLPDQYLHQPWEAPAEVLRGAGVELGRTYPRPIVDHHEARQQALEALATIKK